MRPDFFQHSFKNLPPQGRVLCIDWGESSVGLAISNLSQSIANPFTQIPTHAIFGPQGLLTIINQERIVGVVFGWPIHMDGSLSPMCHKVAQAAKILHDINPHLPLFAWDERMTSKQADSLLGSVFSSFKKREDKKDKVAASLILDGFLRAVQKKGR